MSVAQLSDPHIVAPGKSPRTPAGFGPVDTAAFLARAVTAINRLDPLPDIVVITGDLVDRGEPDEYDHLRRLIAPLRMPVFVIPGNHDARDPLRAAFGTDGYLSGDGFIQYVIEDFPLRLVGLDTLVTGKHHGELCADRLGWLERTLSVASTRPTIVMMHHPPFATGIAYMDKYGLENCVALAAVITGHPQVQRILCGHLHRSIDCRFAGTVAGTAPSTAHQVG